MAFSSITTLPLAQMIVGGNFREMFRSHTIWFPYLLCGALASFALTCTFSCIAVSVFGRRTLLLIGFSLLTAAHMTISVLSWLYQDQGALIYMIVIGLVTITTIAPVSWIYSAETQPDIGLGVQFVLLMLILLFASPLVQYMD